MSDYRNQNIKICSHQLDRYLSYKTVQVLPHWISIPLLQENIFADVKTSETRQSLIY